MNNPFNTNIWNKAKAAMYDPVELYKELDELQEDLDQMRNQIKLLADYLLQNFPYEISSHIVASTPIDVVVCENVVEVAMRLLDRFKV